ncbi:uncharacterized protein LAJ45_10088 [Morchella importuna]|nr:uncharacterized protein LAJ45_10088 [Morchella importuna]KAH8145946.1 hypothetical protein LAJ45_10088 [Morchella importuna]
MLAGRIDDESALWPPDSLSSLPGKCWKSPNTQAAFNNWILQQQSPAAPDKSPTVSDNSPQPNPRAPRKSYKRPRPSPLSRVSSRSTTSSSSVAPYDSVSTAGTESTATSTSSVFPWCNPTLEDLTAQLAAMKNLLNISENETLESIVFAIAKTAYEKEEFDRCQLWILDSVTRKTLPDKSQEMVKMPQIPEVPAKLLTYLERYREVKTLEDCFAVAAKPHADLFDTITDTTKTWIDDVMKFSYKLITTSFLTLPLHEGCYDSSVHPLFWQNYFLDSPLFCQQKETKLPTPNPTSPLAALRWDGIFLPKRALINGTRPAFGLVEVCRDIGTDAVKSRRDWQKLLVGCREILAVLRCAVEGDAKTISELAVVGVLMTGAQTTVMVMGCIGENLYAVVEGGTHVFPPDLSGMAKGVSKYVQPIWRAKEIMLRSHALIETYFEDKNYEI